MMEVFSNRYEYFCLFLIQGPSVIPAEQQQFFENYKFYLRQAVPFGILFPIFFLWVCSRPLAGLLDQFVLEVWGWMRMLAARVSGAETGGALSLQVEQVCDPVTEQAEHWRGLLALVLQVRAGAVRRVRSRKARSRRGNGNS